MNAGEISRHSVGDGLVERCIRLEKVVGGPRAPFVQRKQDGAKPTERLTSREALDLEEAMLTAKDAIAMARGSLAGVGVLRS